MALECFLKLGDIKGESVKDGHKDEIEVLAWSWGMSQSGTTHMGTGGGAGKVNVQDISFTHYVDKGSPTIIQACCKGNHYPEATLTMRKAGGGSPLEYVVIKLSDVIITSVSTGGSGGEDLLTENVTLNFAKFEYSYQPQDNKGAKLGGAVKVTYDIAQNK